MVVSIRKEKKQIDIKVDEKMKVTDMLSVIDESGLIKIEANDKLRAEREDKDIILDLSFFDNEIYNGDILKVF